MGSLRKELTAAQREVEEVRATATAATAAAQSQAARAAGLQSCCERQQTHLQVPLFASHAAVCLTCPPTVHSIVEVAPHGSIQTT